MKNRRDAPPLSRLVRQGGDFDFGRTFPISGNPPPIMFQDHRIIRSPYIRSSPCPGDSNASSKLAVCTSSPSAVMPETRSYPILTLVTSDRNYSFPIHTIISMPWGLQRIQQTRCLHFITFSCHARDPLLSDPHARDIFEQTLERVRTWYGFFVSGCGAPPGNMNARRRSQDYNSLRLSGPDIPTSEGELMRLTKMLVVLLVIALF